MLQHLSKSTIIKAGVALGLSYLIFKMAGTYKKSQQPSQSIPLDFSSFSNLAELTTESFHLELFLDFSSKKLIGSIILNMKTLKESVSLISLDSKLLKIKAVFYKGEKVPFTLEKVLKAEALGERLLINLPEKLKLSSLFAITIEYETDANSSESSALNWLEPSQTFGKKLPYFYTQSEPIYSRTIAPMQDSPSVKSSYSAKIKVRKEFNVFMSANKTGEFTDETYAYYDFKQEIPIPSYLLALVAGNIEQRTISRRSGVITEPEQMDFCAKELEDLEKFIETIEDYLFEYLWGPYNVVGLPPSFPYGGMENPLLTFVNPSIITGDKSNIDVVIHEIAHSWAGNLVTCKNWSHFWLNEGITMFLERKAVKVLYGEKKYQIDALMEDMDLKETITSIGEGDHYTSLQPDFSDYRNPDDAFSKVPYEKGFQFMTHLERIVGEEGMRGFLRFFMRRYSFKSCDTKDFIECFREYFVGKMGKTEGDALCKTIQWDEWLKKPGFPPVKLEINISDFDDCKNLAEDFVKENVVEIEEKFNAFDVSLKIVFLKHLLGKFEEISFEKMKVLR